MASKNLLKLGFLEAQKTAFLACDIQESFKPHMKYWAEMVAVANKMAQAASILQVPLYVSEQYPKGLGHTSKDFSLENARCVYEKTQFSMVTPSLRESLAKDRPNCLGSVVLFGLETHVCIEQTAMDFLSEGVEVHVVADACISRSQQDRILALRRLDKLGCHIATSESVLFKLLRDKTHANFKEVSALCRQPTSDSLGFEALGTKSQL